MVDRDPAVAAGLDHVDEALRQALVLDDPDNFLVQSDNFTREYLGIYEEPAAAITH